MKVWWAGCGRERERREGAELEKRVKPQNKDGKRSGGAGMGDGELGSGGWELEWPVTSEKGHKPWFLNHARDGKKILGIEISPTTTRTQGDSMLLQKANASSPLFYQPPPVGKMTPHPPPFLLFNFFPLYLLPLPTRLSLCLSRIFSYNLRMP